MTTSNAGENQGQKENVLLKRIYLRNHSVEGGEESKFQRKRKIERGIPPRRITRPPSCTSAVRAGRGGGKASIIQSLQKGGTRQKLDPNPDGVAWGGKA